MVSSCLSDYQLTSIVAQCCGGAAVVYSAVHTPSGRQVALKRYFVDKSKENANLIQQEITTWKEVQHANILPYLTSFVHGHELYVVSPLLEYGSCRALITKHFPEGLPEPLCASVLRQVLCALEYLHGQGYIHRGVRASHVLLGRDGAACLAGLRSAGSLLATGRRQRSLHALPPPEHNNANLVWLSPELLEQNIKGYDEKSDIYSVGMLCCELANGAIPFSDVPRTLMLTEKVRGSCPQLLDATTFPAHAAADDDHVGGMYHTDSGVGDSVASGSALHIRQLYASRKLSNNFHQFCTLCLQREPEKRPTATQLLSHPFLKQVRRSESLRALAAVEPIHPQPDDISALQLQEKISTLELDKGTDWEF